MLYFIGLGLGDFEDITIKGLKAIESCSKVFLERYTSILGGNETYKNDLETFYKKEIILADRTMVEERSEDIIDCAVSQNVAFLVVGDPFGATTHTDLVLRCHEKKIPYKIIHNASIMNAIGCCGLQLYNFGETVSFCFWIDNWRPKSYFIKICENRQRGLHTLCLLDIKVKEKSVENLIKGRDIYEPARFMSVETGCIQLIDIIKEAKEFKPETEEEQEEEQDNKEAKQINKLVESNIINNLTLAVGLARVGRDDQLIVVDSIQNLAKFDMGSPLHSLIIVGRLHPLEKDFLKLFYSNSQELYDDLVNKHNEFYSN
jgi:diphthine methyl ester synthase